MAKRQVKAARLRRVLFSVMLGAMMCLALAIARQYAPYPSEQTSATAQAEAEEYVRMHREVTSLH
jgi:hypothetical protein